ncbi:MAG: DedA family protein [Jiangellaceae bacterium]
MPSWITNQPFLLAFVFLLIVVFVRAQGTYWLGRGARAGALQTRLARRLTGPRMTKATAALNKWGWPLITVSFLTVGLQTLVNAAAGLTRMRWPRYTLAMLPGCAAWAAIYATVGLAAFEAWMALSMRSAFAPWIVAAVLGPAAVVVVVRLRRRRAGHDNASTSKAITATTSASITTAAPTTHAIPR